MLIAKLKIFDKQKMESVLLNMKKVYWTIIKFVIIKKSKTKKSWKEKSFVFVACILEIIKFFKTVSYFKALHMINLLFYRF